MDLATLQQSKKILFLVGGLIASLIVLFAIAAVSNRFLGEKPISADPRAFTTLAAVASKEQVSTGETFSIDITVDTHENLVLGAELHLDYDPAIIAIDDVTKGDFLQNALVYNNSTNTGEGIIVYALGSPQEKKGTGVLVKLMARAVGKTKGKEEVLTIMPTTLVSEFDNKNSVLKKVKGASIVIR